MNKSILNTSFFFYVTPAMIITMIIPVLLIAMNFSIVRTNFETNVPLNGTIFIAIFYAMYRGVYNNIKLRQSVVFLRKVELAELESDISPERKEELMDYLFDKASLLNTSNMVTIVENMPLYGFARFTDNDARLVKHKFGYRARTDRQIVNYFAGILVMLGLIGTFWGLLLTIDSVGQAMGEVSKSFAAGGEQDIGGFIASISAPLQGMGLAFSSSLFGLSGSLFLGFINFFAGNSQNNVIEAVSRWIDEHIPEMNPKLKEKSAHPDLPKGEDLKSWLAGFVYLSVQMNKKLELLSRAVSQSAKASYLSSKQLGGVGKRLESIDHQISSSNMNLTKICGYNEMLLQKIQDAANSNIKALDVLENINQQVTHMNHKAEFIQQENQKNNQNSQIQVRSFADLSTAMVEMQKKLSEQNNFEREAYNDLDLMSNRIDRLGNEIHSLVDKIDEDFLGQTGKNVYDVMKKMSQGPDSGTPTED